GKNSLNRLIRCVCGKKIGPDPRNFNQRVSLGRNDLLIRTFPSLGLCPLLLGKINLHNLLSAAFTLRILSALHPGTTKPLPLSVAGIALAVRHSTMLKEPCLVPVHLRLAKVAISYCTALS
ncbi:hypothetical protein ABK732_29670, partial [Klebsiella michiganensis]|uniref:hypothetical protein n=5 Tax=Enterobacteriaceae TaxID=543 RepID=UPI001C498724